MTVTGGGGRPSPSLVIGLVMRVYAVEPDVSKGELSGVGFRVYTHRGVRVPMPVRVELDGDSDRGMATVTLVVCGGDGFPLIDFGNSVPCLATVRTWVMVLPAGEPVAYEPDAKLWDAGGGVFTTDDPLPQVNVPVDVVHAAN